MNILYFDCMSGVSGDMLVGAFLDMGIEPAALARELEKVALPAVYDIEAEKVDKNGVRATAFRVCARTVRAQYPLAEAARLIAESGLDAETKKMALRILKFYSDARVRVHGDGAEGECLCADDAVIAIVNIISAAVCVSWLGPEAIVCSPLTEGCGFAETCHGLMRVPVPLVMELMRSSGAAMQVCGEQTQLITPTGAAIVCALAQRFDALPSMTVGAVGFGAGAKDLDSRANVLRVVMGRNEHRFFEESVCVIDTESAYYAGGFLAHLKRKK